MPDDMQSIFKSVRSHDPDRYLTALMAPRRVRDAFLTLYAFNVELTRIPVLVSEPALGEIRLQWWRDTIDNLTSDLSSGPPLATALGKAISKYDLPKPLLIGMIDARSADLDGGGFPDMEALKAYLYKSEGVVFALSAHMLGASDAGTGRASNMAGLAVGLTKLMCNLVRDASAGKIMLPLLMLENHDLHVDRVLAGTCAEEIKPVLADLAVEARAARDAAKAQMKGIDPVVRPVFAPLALVESYLKSLEQPDHNPMQHRADINPLSRFWRLWRAA